MKKGNNQKELKINRFKERGWTKRSKSASKSAEKKPPFKGAVIKIKPAYIMAAITAVVVAVSFAVFFYGSAVITGVRQTNDELNLELSSVQTQLEDSNEEIGRLEQEMEKLEKALEDAQEDSGKNDNKKIKELTGRIEELSGQVDDLRRQLDLKDGNKKVYLTFDDGPSENTLKILDILEERDVTATFFVINTGHNAYMKNIVDSGNAIALHSYTHDYSLIYASEKAFWEDYESIRALVKKQTGVETNVFRFPGGTANRSSETYSKGIMTKLAASAIQKGVAYFDWNAVTGDADGTAHTKAEMIEIATEPVGRELDRVILLMHDSADKTDTPKILPEIIEVYKQNGYVFEVLSEDTPPMRQEVKN